MAAQNPGEGKRRGGVVGWSLGGGTLSVVAALLYSWLHCACASNYRQRRGGPVQHVVPFRAGETMLENRSVIRRIPEASEKQR